MGTSLGVVWTFPIPPFRFVFSCCLHELHVRVAFAQHLCAVHSCKMQWGGSGGTDDQSRGVLVFVGVMSRKSVQFQMIVSYVVKNNKEQ